MAVANRRSEEVLRLLPSDPVVSRPVDPVNPEAREYFHTIYFVGVAKEVKVVVPDRPAEPVESQLRLPVATN